MVVGVEFKLQQSRAVVEEKQAADEVVEIRRAVRSCRVGNAQRGHGLPELAPAFGEHERPHHIRERQEVENAVEDLVREVPDVDLGADCLLGRHSVEHLVLLRERVEERCQRTLWKWRRCENHSTRRRTSVVGRSARPRRVRCRWEEKPRRAPTATGMGNRATVRVAFSLALQKHVLHISQF